MMVELSVVIPAYNEEKRIGATLASIARYLQDKERLGAKGFLSWEIIVVDDGSKDRTVEVARDVIKDSRVIILKNTANMGKGYSVQRGVLNSNGEVILFSDADLSTPIEEIEKILPLLNSGFDIVIGSRALPDSAILVPQPWYRQIMGKVFNLLVRAFFVKGLKDTQCGFKCFKRKSALDIFNLQRLSGFAFDVEILYIAKKLGIKITDVPIRWLNSPDSRVRLLQGSLSMLIDIIKIKFYDWGGYYKKPLQKDKP